jgi:hypothetical protein
VGKILFEFLCTDDTKMTEIEKAMISLHIIANTNLFLAGVGLHKLQN